MKIKVKFIFGFDSANKLYGDLYAATTIGSNKNLNIE